MDRDGWLIVTSRIVRSAGLGLVAVVLPIYLSELGYDPFQVGLTLTCALGTSAAFSFYVGALERKVGPKKVLMGFTIASMVSGVALALATNYAGVLAASLLGTLNLASSGAGPFQAVEQAVLPQTSPERKRLSTFALYNTGGSLASSLGALASGLPAVLAAEGVHAVDSFRLLFLVYCLLAVASLLLYSRLSIKVEKTPGPISGSLLSAESRRRIGRLSSLMGLDAFGGGFVLQSIVSLWFYTRFGASLGQLSLIFFAFGLLSSASYLVSARIAYRVGLVRTMVFTHLPSNILTMLIPLAPTLLAATAMYLVRSFLNPMDVAPRQAYIAAIVKREERVAAAGYTNTATGIMQAVSPSIAGYFLQFVSSLSFPFIAGGGLKALYDLGLYRSFNSLKEGEIEQKSETSRLSPDTSLSEASEDFRNPETSSASQPP